MYDKRKIEHQIMLGNEHGNVGDFLIDWKELDHTSKQNHVQNRLPNEV